MTDQVNHPPHYTSHPSGVECIQVTEHMGFNLGNAVKYIWRADEKGNAIQDLEKARWYINRELQRRQSCSDSAQLGKEQPHFVRDGEQVDDWMPVVGETWKHRFIPNIRVNVCDIRAGKVHVEYRTHAHVGCFFQDMDTFVSHYKPVEKS